MNESTTPAEVPVPARHAPRLAHIVAVVARHGLSHLLYRLGLRTEGDETSPVPREAARHARQAMEELGPTFVKFGQMLSVRRDLFGDEVIAEFQQLQDAVAPFDTDRARSIIEQELGAPVGELFLDFENQPLAAASIAQVHRARLGDGTEVIVKVQRPGIHETIEADLQVLTTVANLLVRRVSESRRYDPVGLVEEFADSIRKELDFRLEGANAERFRDNFAGEPAIYVPGIFWTHSSARVLTMEFSHGRKFTDEWPSDPGQRAAAARLLARLFLVQALEHGFFHGDPHPANVFLMDDGRLCFHDFGIVGRLHDRDRENLRQIFLALMLRDGAWMADVYAGMGVAGPGVDREAFGRDLEQSLESYLAVAKQDYSFSEILRQFIRLGRAHDIRLPREFLLVAKAFMQVESLAHRLDPRFNMVQLFQEFAPGMMTRSFMPQLSRTQAWVGVYRSLGALRGLIREAPEAISRAMASLTKGEAALRVRHERLEGLERHIERASNRLGFSLIVAAVVVASSILVSAHSGPHLEGIPLLGLVGYVIAGVLGLWWAIAVLRSGKL